MDKEGFLVLLGVAVIFMWESISVPRIEGKPTSNTTANETEGIQVGERGRVWKLHCVTFTGHTTWRSPQALLIDHNDDEGETLFIPATLPLKKEDLHFLLDDYIPRCRRAVWRRSPLCPQRPTFWTLFCLKPSVKHQRYVGYSLISAIIWSHVSQHQI